MVERFWDIIEDISINSVLHFLRDNIVGTVLIVSIILWIPVSCVISYIDAKRLREYQKYVAWLEKDQLVHPADPTARRVIKISRRGVGSGSCPAPPQHMLGQQSQGPRRTGSARRAPDGLSVLQQECPTVSGEVGGFPGTAL